MNALMCWPWIWSMHAAKAGWLLAAHFCAAGCCCWGIVQAGGTTIREQRRQLQDQLIRTEAMSQQNLDLRQKVVFASSRATAQTERTIRRIGFDLHDGPAQYLALASLRLDGALGDKKTIGPDANEVRNSLDKALSEIRIISRGLALPDLDTLDVGTLVRRAIADHEKQTEMTIELAMPDAGGPRLTYAQKLCVYRFLQETLSNAARHAKVQSAVVRVNFEGTEFAVVVSDAGLGFDPDTALKVRSDGGQGLLGLVDRAESIGGSLTIKSTETAGTNLTLILPLSEAVA